MDDELILNEAEGLNKGSLPTGEDLPTRPDDPTWNDLYKQYLNPSNIKGYVISVKGFHRKTPDQNEPNDGFVNLQNGTTSQKRKNFLWVNTGYKDVINSADLTIVANEEDATIFKGDDVDTVIKAIQRNKDFNLKGTSFSKKQASKSLSDSVNYSTQIMLAYFDVLAGEGMSDKLRAATSQLNSICRQRQQPLLGNRLFDMLKSILTNPDASFVADNRSVTMLNNLVADRIFSSEDIINPNKMTASLTYNRSFYNYDLAQIKKLFQIYEACSGLSMAEVTNPVIQNSGMKMSQIAKHILVNTGNETDGDNFEIIVRQLNGWENVELDTIGYKPEGDLIRRWIVRSPEEAQGLYNILFESADRKERDSSFTRIYLQVVKENNVTATEFKQSEGEEGVIEGTISNINLEKDAVLRVVKVAAGVDAKNAELRDLIPTLGANYFRSNTLVKYENNSLICVADSSTSVEVEVGKGKNKEGKEVDKLNSLEFKSPKLASDTHNEKEEPEQKPTEEQPQQPSETPVEETNSAKTYANKTLDAMKAMTPEEWESFSSQDLTPELKAELQQFGRRLIQFKGN